MEERKEVIEKIDDLFKRFNEGEITFEQALQESGLEEDVFRAEINERLEQLKNFDFPEEELLDMVIQSQEDKEEVEVEDSQEVVDKEKTEDDLIQDENQDVVVDDNDGEVIEADSEVMTEDKVEDQLSATAVMDKISEKAAEELDSDEEDEEAAVYLRKDNTNIFDGETFKGRAGDVLDEGDTFVEPGPLNISDVETDDEYSFVDNGLGNSSYRKESYVAPIHTYEYEEEKLPWYASKYALIGAALAALALLVFLAWIISALLGFGKNRNDNGIIPSNNNVTPSQDTYVYEGKDVSVGKAYGESLGYDVVVVEQYSDITQKGRIMSSKLEKVNGKDVLTLYVSLGSESTVDPNSSSNEGSGSGSSDNSGSDSSSSDSSNNGSGNESASNRVIIPSGLARMNKTEAERTLNSLGIKYNINNAYSDNVNDGIVISTDPALGSTINKDTTTIVLTISDGKPVISNFEGKQLSQLESEINRLNEKGAQLTLKTVNEASTQAKNTILYQDKIGRAYIGSIVTATISTGEDLSNKDFKGKSFEELKEFANAHGLTINYTEQYSDTISSGTVISQSPTNFNDYSGVITAVVSRGRYQLPNMRGKTVEEFEYELAEAYRMGQTLKYRYIEEYADDIAAGRIITAVYDGDVITAYVSRGAAPKYSYIPSQVGKTVQEVQASQICQRYTCIFTKQADSTEVHPGETKITVSPAGQYQDGDRIEFEYIRGIKRT